MVRWSAHRFAVAAADAGLDPQASKAAWDFVSALQSAGLPGVLTLRQLANDSGVSYKCLRGVVTRQWIAERYRSFRMTKRSGGVRRIFVPTRELQQALAWINRNILGVASPHPRAFGFRPKLSIVDCAIEHCGARWLVKFDVANFFESIHEAQAYRVFARLGYPALLAFEMARLTTVPIGFLLTKPSLREEFLRRDSLARPTREYSINGYAFPEHGRLGQGLATSPALSNLVCYPLDNELEATAQSAGFVYTRYADDLTFSSPAERLSAGTIRHLRQMVTGALGRAGMRENRKKFSVAGPGARRMVLGLLVDGTRPRLSRASRARIEGHIYFLLKHGVAAHAEKRGFGSPDGLRQHFNGLLAFVNQLEPTLAQQYASMAARIEWPPE